MSTSAEIVNGIVTLSSGPSGKAASLVKLKIACDIDNAASYGVPTAIFANDARSIPTVFPNVLRLEVQLDFKHDNTSASSVDVRDFGNWIGEMVKLAKGLKFSFPCEIYVAVTDATHLYQDSNDNLVAVGEEADRSDQPVVVILGNRGRLVQVGQTS
ncbi:uncharacterized protein RCC_08740 [Ramularia collo-cygni]|uniref:Uncharacterized protein n=1 Tax=Ramularia collo-cygni TaxID=112498 RepID=A0A2D3V7Z1_9PEZI|nr:uncharacterized protein RCC_08740 [Ramularia collo-cygni]CZT23030.1 uncharacterized protein RCC_08740 [Ramularia collo-cygni]